MQIRPSLAVSVFSVLGVLACGESDDGGSGVSGSTKVSDLSASEAKSVCTNLQAKFMRTGAATAKITCTAQALALSPSSCASTVDDCVAQAEDDPDFDLDCEGDDGDSAGVPEDCADVTVSEIEACVEATAKQTEALAAKLSCSSDLADFSNTDTTAPAACTKLADRCPDLSGEDP
jgi:hypothetical protein